MEIADFELERYFARWEFAVDHLLCASDPEPVPMGELLGMANPGTERLWASLRLGYTESAGHPLLRAEIAGTYRTVDPDQVLVCSGAQEAIFVVLGAMLGPGDHHDRELLGRFAARKDYTTICNSAPSEILALIGLRAADRLLERSGSRGSGRTWRRKRSPRRWWRPRASCSCPGRSSATAATTSASASGAATSPTPWRR